jgi:hypothetical protein
MPFLTQGKTNWKYILIVVFLAVIVGGGTLIWQLGLPEFIKFPLFKKPATSKEFTLGLNKGAKITYEFYLSTGSYRKHEYLIYLNDIDSISKSAELNAIGLDYGLSCFSNNENIVSLGDKFICKVTEEGGAHFKLIKLSDVEATFETWFQIGSPHPEGPFLPKDITITALAYRIITNCQKIFQETGNCPTDRCETCCGGDGTGVGCAAACCEKMCTAFQAENCPQDYCTIMINCEGKEVCYNKLSGEIPTCGPASYYGQDVECCEGLVKRCGIVLPDGSCDTAQGGYQDFPWCLPCGNGICDQFENKCSCPEDCKEKKLGKIIISSPVEGEIWAIGETYQIRWEPHDPTKTVGITLSDTRIPTASLSKVWQKENFPDIGTFSFTVPKVSPGNAYQIYISSKEKYGYSDLFSIASEKTCKIISEAANWKICKNEDFGLEFQYPSEWLSLSFKSQINDNVYRFTSQNDSIYSIYYYKPLKILSFIEKGEEVECVYGGKCFQQTLKIIYPSKEIKTIYTVSLADVKWDGTITGVNISPNGKYVSFILSVYEISKPLMINIETNKDILEGVHVNFVPDEDIFWSPNNEVLAIRSETNDFAGIGICGVFVSDYGNPEKLNEVFSIPWEKHINGIHMGKIQFIDNERVSFEVGEGIEKYIYNAKTKELTKIK